MIVAQTSAGPAAGEGIHLYQRGLPPDEALARSYYATRAPMVRGEYHVMSAYAAAAKEAGEIEKYRRATELALTCGKGW